MFISSGESALDPTLLSRLPIFIEYFPTFDNDGGGTGGAGAHDEVFVQLAARGEGMGGAVAAEVAAGGEEMDGAVAAEAAAGGEGMDDAVAAEAATAAGGEKMSGAVATEAGVGGEEIDGAVAAEAASGGCEEMGGAVAAEAAMGGDADDEDPLFMPPRVLVAGGATFGILLATKATGTVGAGAAGMQRRVLFWALPLFACGGGRAGAAAFV